VIAAALASLLIGTSVAMAQTESPSQTGPFSLGVEALVWWFKDSPAPTPLVTDGLLNQPGTSVLLGGRHLDTNPNPGFRVSAGYSLTEQWELEANFFYVPSRSTGRSVSSSGEPGTKSLRIPFFDVTLPGESATGLSSAGLFSGSAKEELHNRLLGAELNGILNLCMMGPLRVDLLGGFRYLRLHETYKFSTNSPVIPPRPPDVFLTKDEFDAKNNFYGAQIGARGRADWGSWFVTGALKVAIGAVMQSVDIDGRLETNDFTNLGVVQTFPGGYFAQPTNMGDHTRSLFAVVPEAAITVGYQITPSVSVFAGYTFLYVSNVVRAAQQVNRNINPTASPSFTGTLPVPRVGPAEPSFKFRDSDFWAQGLNVGLAFRF
jgi:hypothetical protein